MILRWKCFQIFSWTRTCDFSFLFYRSSSKPDHQPPTARRSPIAVLRVPKHLPGGRTSSHPRGPSTGLWSPCTDQPQPQPRPNQPLCLQVLRSDFPPAQLAAAALRPVPAEAPAVLSAARSGKQEDQTAALPTGMQPFPLHGVQPGVQPHGEPQDSPSHPHGREALHLLGLLQVFPSLRGINQALPYPHRREALHLRTVWEVFQKLWGAQIPPAFTQQAALTLLRSSR